MKDGLSLNELERALVKAELKKQPDGTDDHALAADFKPRSGQGERGGGHGGRN